MLSNKQIWTRVVFGTLLLSALAVSDTTADIIKHSGMYQEAVVSSIENQ